MTSLVTQNYQEFQELGRGLLAYVIGKSEQRKPIDLWHALETYEVVDRSKICVLSLIAIVNAAHTSAAFHEYLPLTPFKWVHCDAVQSSDVEEHAIALLERISEMIEAQVTELKQGKGLGNDLVVFMRQAYQEEELARTSR